MTPEEELEALERIVTGLPSAFDASAEMERLELEVAFLLEDDADRIRMAKVLAAKAASATALSYATALRLIARSITRREPFASSWDGTDLAPFLEAREIVPPMDLIKAKAKNVYPTSASAFVKRGKGRR